MNKNIKNIIIIVVIVICGGVGYLLLFGNSKDSNSNSSLIISDSSISAQTVDAQISSDTAFLSTLLGLSNIKIDSQLFFSKSFNSLEDNTVEIVNDGRIGRPNPFAPFEDAASLDSTTSLPPTINTNTSSVNNNQ
jgi:hypothetical protein